jgi:hypothetical protein
MGISVQKRADLAEAWAGLQARPTYLVKTRGLYRSSGAAIAHFFDKNNYGTNCVMFAARTPLGILEFR